MKTLEVKRGEIIQRQGDLNSKIYHVEKGLLRSYTIDEKGKEHIFMFGPEGWVVADANPADIPAELFIDVLEDSILYVAEKEPSKESKNIKPLLKRLSVLQKRVLLLMSASAIERYEHFIKTYPNILLRVPQKMIASYLGMTPEALSKVKNKKVKES